MLSLIHIFWAEAAGRKNFWQRSPALRFEQWVWQNEGYLTVLARSCCEPFSQHSLEEDLKQEGAMVLVRSR